MREKRKEFLIEVSLFDGLQDKKNINNNNNNINNNNNNNNNSSSNNNNNNNNNNSNNTYIHTHTELHRCRQTSKATFAPSVCLFRDIAFKRF